jgi:hypothetical protein
MMNVPLCDAAFAALGDAAFAALAGMMVPAAEVQLLIAGNGLIWLTPSLGSGGG